MKKHRLQNILRNAILIALVFMLVSEPVLVAAKTLQKDSQTQAVDLVLQSGELYLDSISSATMESAKLINYISVVQNTPTNQLNEAYIEDVIDRALGVAEQTSVALGAVDNMADGIEQIGNNLPVGVDIGQAVGAGIPDEMRAELIAQGISSSQVDQINSSASGLFTARQSAATGLPANVQADLLSYGFTQAQVDEVAVAVGQRGLVNGNLNTRLAQFRATQDELADARSSMVILAVQLLGYQIAVRQSNGLQPRAATDAELQALAEDELRLLIHAAHLNAMWGNDPSAEIGEGDWWFIEHFAERAGDRLQTIIVETQNRGLVAELFVIRQMKMLAVSARSGDAEYAKVELDTLTTLLAHQLNATAYYQQHASPAFPEFAFARLVTAPSLREKVQWPVASSAIKTAMIISQEKMDSAEVQNLAIIIGEFDESDETNNQAGILFITGLLFFDDLDISILQPSLQILSSASIPNISLEWLRAILTGNTDNPALLAANVLLSIIPVIGVLPDIISLVYDESYFVKALSLLGIIGSLGDLAALLGVTIPIAVASFVGDVSAAVIKGLFKISDSTFRLILDSLKLTDSFEVVLDLTRTAVKDIGGSLGSSLGEVTTAINNVFKADGLWGSFVTWVSRRKAALLLQLGFDQGSELVGRILKLGVDLSDESLVGLEKVADDLVAAGMKLSKEEAEGLGKLAKSMSADDFQVFVNKLGSTCSVGSINSSAKLAIPSKRAGTICNPQLVKKVLTSYKRFTPVMSEGSGKIAKAIGSENWAELMLRYANDPDNLADAERIFGKLGNAVDADVINIAMSKGPEAVSAMSHWDEALLRHSKQMATELANRSGKDAQSLEIIKTWTSNSTPGLEAVGRNSRDGIGVTWGLGPNASGYDKGFVQFARDEKAQFYFTHPEVSAKVNALFPAGELRDTAFWKINQSALLDGADSPINKGMSFLYQIHPDYSADDIPQINVIFNGFTEQQFVAQFGEINFRMKEMFLLKSKGYIHAATDATGNFIFKKTP